MENKNKIQAIVTGVIAVALIAGGVYYYNKDKNQDGELATDITNTEAVDENNVSTTPDTTTKEETSTPTTNQPAVDIKAKFNTALASGATAFNAGKYDEAIIYYNQALKYQNSDVVYVRLYAAYNAKGDIAKAQTALNKAITINSAFTDYWVTKLVFYDQYTSASFADLKKIYQEGLTKVGNETKVNLVTQFARTAESNGQINEAISALEYAKTIYSANSSAYQAEIDRLKSL